MKKIKKIGALIVICILNFYNTCFADLVWIDENGQPHSGGGIEPPVLENKSANYILIGIIVLVIVVCAIFIIRRIIKKKKEK